MSNYYKLTIAVLILLTGAGAGYWIGNSVTFSNSDSMNASTSERKVLYYRNPMGLPDTSVTPKKDSMGMDYLPVYEGEELSVGQLNISTDKVQRLGVKSVAATLRELNKTLRVTGRIEVNERHTYTIAPKFSGWVEKLHVNTTGQAVSKGQPLFEVYSPDLVATQREYAIAMQGLSALKNADPDAQASMQRLADASRARLQNWNIGEVSFAQNEIRPRVTFHAPFAGVVLKKMAVEGMSFMPGETLYELADLSTVWIIADIPEQDIGQVKIGSSAQASIDAYPERRFEGKVSFIYPMLNSATRTVPVRIEIDNPHTLLKPAMYVSATIGVGKRKKVLSIPSSAVIDSGTRQVALVRLDEGRFEPRAVTLGLRGDGFVEVLDGIAEGEQVVTAANFLLDAESNLKAALADMSGAKKPAQNGATDQAVQSQQSSNQHTVSHIAKGELDAINADGSVKISHGPIASLGWPAMTMSFEVANAALLKNLTPGSMIEFEFVERAPRVWVITKMDAATQNGVN